MRSYDFQLWFDLVRSKRPEAIAAVERYLQEHASELVSAVDRAHGRTGLHHCVELNHTEKVLLLLQHGALLNGVDKVKPFHGPALGPR